MHADITQVLVGPHAFPHAPQFEESATTDVSHPVSAAMSQSPKPALQEPIAHVPPTQLATPFVGFAHGFPHIPQFVTSVAVSTQPPLQRVSP